MHRNAGSNSQPWWLSMALVALASAGLVGGVSCSRTAPPRTPSAAARAAAPAPPAEEQAAAPEPPTRPAAVQFPVALLTLAPKAAEYGTRPDPEGYQTKAGPGVIDTAPVKPRNDATWFWPGGLKIVTELPPDDFELPEGRGYRSAQTKYFASEGFFVTGVGLWARTRNMYHWVEYEIPAGAARFTGDLLVTDDPLGWMAGERDALNQQFEVLVFIDGQRVAKHSATRHRKLQGSGEKLAALDIPLPPDAKTIRFDLDVTPWGAGNKNIEVVLTDGTFHGRAN